MHLVRNLVMALRYSFFMLIVMGRFRITISTVNLRQLKNRPEASYMFVLHLLGKGQFGSVRWCGQCGG